MEKLYEESSIVTTNTNRRMHLDNIPAELRELKQWILWKRENRPVEKRNPDGTTRMEDKWTKVPYQPNGRMAASTRPEEWSSFDDCAAVVESFSGMGFVFAEGVVGIDLDHCIHEDGTVERWAREVMATFDSYTEISPSGDGLHIIILSDVPLKGRKNEKGIECYSTGRFFTMTGNVFEGRDTLRDCDVIDWYKETFPPKSEALVVLDSGQALNLPSDDKILSVMFRGKNGEKLSTLYRTGDYGRFGFTSQSQADLSLVGSLMFYCGNDAATVDRLFRSSALMRPKWDEYRGDRTYGEITIAKSSSSETMKWKKAEGYILSNGKDPYPMLILENICRAFDSDENLSALFRLNDFSHAIEIYRGGEWTYLQDYDILEAQRYVSTHFTFFEKVSKEMIMDAIRCTAYNNKVNPPVDYLSELTWDGKPRLNGWLQTVYGVDDTELYQKMGSNWIKGLVKRVLQPGCQFDEVLVLESPQGYRKSTSLRILGQPWHVESTLSTEDKDFYMLLARSVIVEFSEGDIVGRTSARKLKSIITKTEDSFRPPYEHGMMTFKRGCVFAMTTNDNDYQKDDTGGRRWLPVVLKKVANVDWLAANRDQLYAEAVHRVSVLKETTHEYPMDELLELQSEKQEGDEYDEIVKIWYDSLPITTKEAGVSVLEAYRDCIVNDGNAKLAKIDEWRVAGIFKRALGLKKKVIRVGRYTVKRWSAQ